MVSRAKKPVSDTKFQVLSLSKAGLVNRSVDKLKQLWCICRQIWYIPFIWALTWYMFWILRDAIVFGKPFNQGNSFNYLGSAISVLALAVKILTVENRFAAIVGKAYVSTKLRVVSMANIFVNSRILMKPYFFVRGHVGGVIGKAVMFLLNQSGAVNHTAPVSEGTKLSRSIELQKPIEEKPQPQQRFQDKSKRQTRRPGRVAPKPQLSQSGNDVHLNTFNYSNDVSASEKIAENCLVCPDLVRCEHRRERARDQEVQMPCRYAAKYIIEEVNAS